MNCPKCGTQIPGPEWRDELKLNRIILIAATVVIVIVIIAAAIYAAGALRPRPELVGDLDTSHYSSDGSDGYYTIKLAGYVYNVGPVACFANVTYMLTDNRGWSYENTSNIGWMPVNEAQYVDVLIEYPVSFRDVEIHTHPILQNIHVELKFEFYDPAYDNRSS